VTNSDSTMPTPPKTAAVISVRRWLLAAGLMLLNLIDVVSTKVVLSLGGTEANPVMSDVMNHPTYPWLTKLAVCLAVTVLLFAAPAASRLAERAVTAVLLFYVAVVAWNISLIVNFYRG